MDKVDLTPLLVGFLVFARVAAMLMAMPVTGNKGIPRTVRMGVALPLAAVLYVTVPPVHIPNTIPQLVVVAGGEVILGVAMGFVVAMLTGAVSLASEVISAKIGLSMASMLDPMTGSHGSTLGALAQTLATGLFFATNMHLDCIRALAGSLQELPPGSIVNPLGAGAVLFEVASTVFMLGVRLAGPLVFFAMMVNLALMVLGRMAPGLQLFFSIGTSFTVIAGILLLGAALPAMLQVEATTLQGAWGPVHRIIVEMGGG